MSAFNLARAIRVEADPGGKPKLPRRSTGTPGQPAPRQPAGVQLRARRSPRLIVIGVLCACLGSLGMAWAWTSSQQSQAVVLVATAVARGERIEAGDLTTTTIGVAPGVATLPAAEAAGLIGQYALVDLPAGALVGPEAIGAQQVPFGTAHLGLRLAAGRLPSQPLTPGSRVALIAVPGSTSEESVAGVEIEAIVVSAAQQMPDGQSWLLDVQVDSHLAAGVAALAAVERIAVVRKADT